MAQKQLLQLPKTQFSGLEYSNILEDVYNMVRETTEYNENWDDFLSSDAGVMITEIYAWITDQLATRIDWVVNENFIGTATQRNSIINLLKLIGYKFQLPAAAQVPVTVTFDRECGVYILTPEYNPNVSSFEPKTVLAKDKKGKIKFFEAVNYDVATFDYLYKLPIELDTSTTRSFNVNFYEGQTKIENFISPSNSGQVFNLSENPVIRNSIQVYEVFVDGGTGDTTEVRLLEVDSFLSLEAQQEENADGTTNEIPYVVNVLEDDAVEVAFGSSSLLADPNRRLQSESAIRIFYRVGGGTDGNISRGAIDTSEDITNNSVDTTIHYYNATEGVGSENSETIEHAAYVGPLQIKTAGKTVTEEDYDIILSSFINVLLSKAYGHNNIPDNYYEKYGTYISPLEVLNFIIMKKSGWEEIPTSKYKYANWGTFNLENYFNEKIAFKDGAFGNIINLYNNNTLTDGHYDSNDEDPPTYDPGQDEDPPLYTQVYDYDNQGGREFYNYMVLRTPQDWKDSIFIEDPNDPGNYIANEDAKASLTHEIYDPEIHQTLENIGDHFVYDAADPYFYGDYNSSGLPRPEIVEDIQAYMVSRKDTQEGVYIGTDHLTDANQLILDIDNHGEVPIDLSVGGINLELVPLDGINGIIDVINTELAAAYNGVFSYHDFGVQIPDTSAVMDTLVDKDYDNWLLRVSGVDFSVDLGSTQTYDDLLAYMNNSFQATGTSGYQDFNDTAPWTVSDTTNYDFNLTVDGVDKGNIVLDAVGDTELTAQDLKALINIAFTNQAIIGVHAEIAGTAVRISSEETGITSTILVEAGASDNLLTITGVMGGAVDGVGLAAANLVATFVPSQINIACYDVRISRTNTSGTVLLEDTGTSTDILAAFGALPITTLPVNHGDYSLVASIEDYGLTDPGDPKYIKLLSPTAGPNSIIKIIQVNPTTRDATAATFGLDFNSDEVTEYVCYGQTRLTIIYRDTNEEDFGDFIYEHGSIHFNQDSPQYIYLNYIKSFQDTIRLGNYYTDNFDEADPEWKMASLRIYNTIYKLDPESTNPNAEIIDEDVTDMLVKFTRNEITDNSIYVIEEDPTLILTESDYPTIVSIDLDGYAGWGAGTFMKIAINDNTEIKVDIGSITSASVLTDAMNSAWKIEANEKRNKNIDFATYSTAGASEEYITLMVDDKTNTGKITIYDDEGSILLGAEIFGQPAGVNTITYPTGDYYLQLFQPQYDSVPPLDAGEIAGLTAEELFGYINMHIITGTTTSIPDLAFNAHMVSDRRHVFLDQDTYRVHTDEDDLQSVLYQYKIAGVDNSFKKPIFSTFDCQANIYITTAASQERVKQNIEDALRTFYSLENTILSQNVNKSEFIGIVLSVNGVRYIDILYFGNNMLYEEPTPAPDPPDPDANQDLTIEADFDEILVLSDNTYDSGGEQTHGLLFNYTTL